MWPCLAIAPKTRSAAAQNPAADNRSAARAPLRAPLRTPLNNFAGQPLIEISSVRLVRVELAPRQPTRLRILGSGNADRLLLVATGQEQEVRVAGAEQHGRVDDCAVQHVGVEQDSGGRRDAAHTDQIVAVDL